MHQIIIHSFFSPTYPQLLNIPVDATAIQALELNDIYKEKTHLPRVQEHRKSVTLVYTRCNRRQVH